MAHIGLKQLDPILTGSLQVSGSAGVTGSLSIRAGDKIFTEADEGTYLQSDSADRLRAVVGGSQMLLMDQDEGRVNVGYGQKLGVGLGNHTTPGVELEVDGDVSGSGLGSFGTVYAGTHITASGNISASGTIFAEQLTTSDDLLVEDQARIKTALVNPDAVSSGDFRVKSENLNHVLYTDANKDRVGIAWNNPAGSELLSSLHIDGDITATAITASGDISSSGTVEAAAFGSSAASMISGSTNPTSVSGSWRGELSSSNMTVVGGGVSGSSTSTGSFGYLNVHGDGVFGGNLTFGDAATDSVSFGADIDSNLIPNSDDTYDLGSASQAWQDLFLEGDITLTDAGTIQTSAGVLTIDGAGGINIGTSADQAIDVDSSTFDLDASGAVTIDGTSTVAIAGASTSTYGDDTAVWSFDGSGALSETGMTTVSLTPSSTVDIDAGGAVTIDGTAITIGGDDSGVAVSIGHTTSETTVKDNLTVAGDLSTGNVAVTGSLVMTGNLTANQYIVSSSVTYLTQSFSSGSTVFGDTSDDIHEFTGSLNVTGSAIVSGSTLKVNTPLTSSTAIFSNNTQVGYPTSNTWDNGLSGSYFQNFDNTTHISEVLRFMSGILSHSLDVSDAAPNNKYYNSIDTNENSLGSTDSINGYLPTNYTSVSNTTLNYLVHKGWTSVGATIFSGISVYHDNGRTHYVDFDSNSAGSSQASSSADSELFGLGSLSSGNANTFGIRVVATQSFSDINTNTSPDEDTNKFTTQSYYDETLTSFGTTNGVELAKINTANPAVIPAAYQDGKFENVGGTSTMSGSLSRKWHATSGSITSVSSSGYYKFHDLAVGIKSGSQSVYDFKSGTDKNRFWAPIDQIDSDIGTNSLADTGTTHKALTATSRSLSGVPYLIDSTFEVSTKITGLFNPMYAATTTLVDMAASSVGTGTAGGSVSITGDTISTSGGTVQTSGKLFQSDGTTAVDSGVPRYNDIAIVTASVTYDSGTSDSIDQTGVADTSFTVATKARNRNSSQSTLDTQTISYHTAGDFGQTTASGSLAIYGRAQGYEGGTLAGTSEAFSGEDFRIRLADNVQAFNGTAWTTTYQLTAGSNQLGDYDLQVKPGFLVDPGGDYRYWYPASFGSGTYKYYIRRFQTSGTKTSMTVDVGATLINWNATTNGVSVALLFESSGNGSGNNSSLSVARIYDPSDLTSNVIETDMSADNFKNPFSTAISLYGNTGGSKSSTEYTLPIRNADGMYLDSNDNEFYLIVRYKGDPTPVTSITISTS